MATIVIVPGSFCPAHLYDTQIASLSRHGIPAVTVPIPSVGRRDGPPATMTDDADMIIDVVEPLLTQGEKVVLLAHSYGGVPTTQSLERLSRRARAAEGKAGGIETVIYLTAVILPVGAANFDTLVGKIPDFLTAEDDYMTIDAAKNAPLTFSDLPTEEALVWANKLVNHSTPSFKEKLSYSGYNDVNIHYILCEKDKIIPPEVQSGMIEMLKATAGGDIGVHRIDCDHAPMVGRTDDVSRIVAEVLQGL